MTIAPESVPGHQQFVDHLSTIEQVTAFVVRRHHATPEEAEDFGSHVKVRLLDQDCAILRKFQGRSSIRTYLTIVISRLFLDYRTSAWGKWRPSQEARRRGEVAVLVERLMTRDGHSLDEVEAMLRTNHRIPISRGELEALVGSFPARTKRRFEDDERLVDVAAAGPTPEERYVDRERASDQSRQSQVLGRLLAGLEPQDRLMLVLHFRDGRKLSEIASILRVPQKPLYGRLDRLLKQLRRALADEGVTSAEVGEPIR